MTTTPASTSFLKRHHFLLRRLHSLTGIIPVGVFLINHLLTNSTAWLGAEHFDEHVEWIHAMPFLLWIEIFGIFLPLAFHAGYGVLIAIQGQSNVKQYPYMDNWRYSLQRLTAWVTLAFIIVHLGHFRFAHWIAGAEYEYKAANPEFFMITAEGFQQLWLPLWVWLGVYVVGLTASVFHFCNGIVTFCITWGITVNDSSRRKLSLGAAGLGAVLMVWGLLSLYALSTADLTAPYEPPPHTEIATNAPAE